METVETKKCAKCHRDLPVTEFWKDSRARDGLNCYCKECMKTFTSKARTRMKINKPDKTRPLKNIPLEDIETELKLRGYESGPTKMDNVINDKTSKEKQTITKVVTVRLFGIKILTITTKTPSFEMDLLSARSGTDETLL